LARLTALGRSRHITTREASIASEKLDKADFKVFTDGSGWNGGIGAAAVIYRKGQHRPAGHRKAYLGKSTKHNTYEGEAVGAILGTWLATVTPGTSGKSVSIYVDNQSVLTAAGEEPKATAGQHLIQALALVANGSGSRITMGWISSHSGVKGNEYVDKLAKEAAEGKATRRGNLPVMLRNGLPVSASAIKQEHMEQLKKNLRSGGPGG
jgi:ribonuclease HI